MPREGRSGRIEIPEANPEQALSAHQGLACASAQVVASLPPRRAGAQGKPLGDERGSQFGPDQFARILRQRLLKIGIANRHAAPALSENLRRALNLEFRRRVASRPACHSVEDDTAGPPQVRFHRWRPVPRACPIQVRERRRAWRTRRRSAEADRRGERLPRSMQTRTSERAREETCHDAPVRRAEMRPACSLPFFLDRLPTCPMPRVRCVAWTADS